MKILVFEYLCGGGLQGATWNDKIVAEGKLMLSALLKDLSQLPEHKVTVILDNRLTELSSQFPFSWRWVGERDSFFEVFQDNLKHCDAAWVIAPETQGLLEQLTSQVVQAEKIPLGCTPDAIRVSTDKWLTFQTLRANRIPTIPTCLLNEVKQFPDYPCILKARDGVGCQDLWLIQNDTKFQHRLSQINKRENFILQAFLKGKHQSLSALFFEGACQVLCLNKQHLNFVGEQPLLEALSVNVEPFEARHQQIASDIAGAVPGLFGYVGIDLLEVDSQLLVTEINPRLTSSYAAISEAIGINCAEQILRMNASSLEINAKFNREIQLTLA